MSVTPQQVAQLRARTGVSMMACKQALEEAGGNEELAIEILRKKGIAQAAKKADRNQSEGLIFVAEEGDKKAAVVMLKCETDFVARDENFQRIGKNLAETALKKGLEEAKKVADKDVPELVQKLGENITVGEMHLFDHPVIGAYLHSNAKVAVVVGLEGGTREGARDAAMHAAAMSPMYAYPEEIPADVIAKEKEIWSEQLKREGKPEAMWDKIMMGKEKKFRQEQALTSQPFVKDPSKTVGQALNNVKVVAYKRLSVR